ncbi:AAA family ATPase [Candidatus Uhrbacteria bacterium]|nr:AAA family ATPase [Candidatus Uhrbacteria bacterium]
MWLQRIDLNGFKSFANATNLEFLPPTAGSRGITAIVGPNGSGKSCVVDAIRWVLGEQSMKLLRGKTSEDVIFAGTPRRPRLGVAEVTLLLNNEDRSAPIDYTEVAITRRVYRSGDAEYLLNGNKVRREDILLLLAGARIGQRTYSIIGQGMVDEFILASPTDRKAFFDEAAGIRPAEIKRNQAIAKLERAHENLRQGETLLAELTPRLRSLSRQVKRLEQRDALEQELRERLAQFHGQRWHELARLMERQRTAWEVHDAERRKLQTSVDQIQGKLSTLEQEEQKSDAFLDLQRSYEALMHRRQELRERMLLLRNAAQTRAGAHQALPATALIADLDIALQDIDMLLYSLRETPTIDVPATLAVLTTIHQRITNLRTRCTPPDVRTPAPELTETEAALREVEREVTEVQRRMSAVHAEEQQKKGAFFELQRNYRAQQLLLNEATARANDGRIELARCEQRREDLRQAILRDIPSTEDPSTLPAPQGPLETDTEFRIGRLQRELATIGTLDEQTLAEYRELEERVAFLTQQTDDLQKSATSLEQVITELELDIDRAFHSAFATINTHFEKYFRQLFGGGNAKLTLLREEPIEESAPEQTSTPIPDIPPSDVPPKRGERVVVGIDIQATPPGKRIKHIAMLSGGERALTAIALLCAIISSSASPFVVLDEVDAALDESNSVRYAEILKDLSQHTQFLVVTHNRSSMERASMIYGVTMGDEGASKLLSLRLEEATQVVRK